MCLAERILVFSLSLPLFLSLSATCRERADPPQYVGRLLGYGNLVIALVGDVPLSFLNAFVLYTDELGSESARYLLVHFGLQLALIGCLVLPFHLHNELSKQRDLSGGGASGQRRHAGGVPYADEDDAGDPPATPADALEEADIEHEVMSYYGAGHAFWSDVGQVEREEMPVIAGYRLTTNFLKGFYAGKESFAKKRAFLEFQLAEQDIGLGADESAEEDTAGDA